MNYDSRCVFKFPPILDEEAGAWRRRRQGEKGISPEGGLGCFVNRSLFIHVDGRVRDTIMPKSATT